MVLYSFTPHIKGAYEFGLKKVENNDDFLKIFDWYKIRLNDVSEIFDVKIDMISHESNKIYFTSKQYIDALTLEDLVDPDSDGNYPIILSDNKTYLIFGKDISVDDHI